MAEQVLFFRIKFSEINSELAGTGCCDPEGFRDEI
jgi:hypothetical protein